MCQQGLLDFCGFKMEMEEIARWAFIAFLVIAILAGLAIGYMAFDARAQDPGGFSAESVASNHGYILLIMLILGFIIGIAGSVTTKEVTLFLIATIALMVAGSSNVWGPLNFAPIEILYYFAVAITTYIAAFAAPAAVIIAIKGVLAMAKEK